MSAGLSLLLVLGVVLRRALAAPRLPRTAAWILVPGHQLRDGTPSPDFQARLARAATLATRSPNARVLVLGGRGGDGRCSEAAIGRTHLEGLGVPGERIHSEERSRNTLENLQQAAARLGDPCGLPLVLVSNRYHLARCLLMARNLGLPVLGAPAEPTLPFSWRLPWQLLWEAYLVHWYLAGWVYASILGNDAMLERVLNRRGIRKWRS